MPIAWNDPYFHCPDSCGRFFVCAFSPTPPRPFAASPRHCVDGRFSSSKTFSFSSALPSSQHPHPLKPKNALQARAVDHASAYEDLEMTHTNYTLHYALMTQLEPGQQYFYELGCTCHHIARRPKRGGRGFPVFHTGTIAFYYSTAFMSTMLFTWVYFHFYRHCVQIKAAVFSGVSTKGQRTNLGCVRGQYRFLLITFNDSDEFNAQLSRRC